MTHHEKPLTIVFAAGEPSGDRQAAALLDALRTLVAPRAVEAWGIGGPMLRAAGVRLHCDSSRFASIGILPTLANVPKIMGIMAGFRRALRRNPPDAIVLVDAGAFNVPLARWIKTRRLCPIFYFFPPSSWRRTLRGTGLAAADRIVTPFPWSETLLKNVGADAHFVGHPLLDLVKPTLPAPDFYARFGLDSTRPIVALLPGSRRQELIHILPALVGAAGEIARRIPGVQFALALAPSAPRELVETLIKREQKRGGRAARLQLFMNQAGGKLAQMTPKILTPPLLATSEGLTLTPGELEDGEAAARERATPTHAPLVICEDLTYDVLARCDLVITKSGTSTLEAAILQKPMIIVYRGSRVMAWEYALRKKSLNIAHAGLPNILAEKRLVPELWQDDATPEAIAQLALEMLLQPERLLRVKEQLAELIRVNLGEAGGTKRAAALLYELIADHDH